MKRYTMSFADSISHVPEHPERTAKKQGRGMNFDVTYQVWPNRAAMMKTIDMQERRESRQDDWKPVQKRNPSPGSLAARVAFGAVAPGATLALTAADIVDAVDQGLLDEAAGVVLKPMEMGGELVGRMVNPGVRVTNANAVALWEATGRLAYRHVRKKTISLNGGKAVPEQEAINRIKQFFASEQGERELAKLGTGERRNPESAAATLYEKFHQTPSTEMVELAETIHEHDYLTTLGTLQTIKLHTLADKQVEIAFTDDRPYLCSNETGTQLYIAGGDQTMDLKALGIGSKLWHKEHMLLGICLEVTYQTKKGFHDFRLTDYYHELGEETGVQPMLAYDTRNCKLSILGGQYQIKPEGITN